MVRRATKAKKVNDINVDSEVSKKVKSKGKQDIDLDLPDVKLEENVQIEKKTKRGKKAADINEYNGTNGVTEKATVIKKGRKKAEPAPEDNGSNRDASDKELSPEIDNDVEINEVTNGNSVEVASSKGKKPKKEAAEKAVPKSRAKKNTKTELGQPEEKENLEDKKEMPKVKGRTRVPQLKIEKTESDGVEDEIAESLAKGKKKASAKSAKKKTPNVEDKSDGETENLEEKKTEDLKEIVEESHKPSKTKKGKKPAMKPTETNGDTAEEPVSKKKKTTKKDGKGDSKDPESATESKPAKGKRALKKQPEVQDDPQEPEETTTKRKRKVEEKASTEATKKPALKNKATTNYDEIDLSSNSKTGQGKEWNFKIASWNVDGIRAWLTKGGLDYIKHEKPDILCLQEVKCSKDKLPADVANIPGYHAYWLCSEKDGYAGVGIYTSKLAMSVQYGLGTEELDSEGRIITAEYEEFYLICTYVPNAGRGLVTLPKRLEWNDAFMAHVKELDAKKPVIICGDMNVAHNEIDLANPKTNRKNAGFTPEERAGMTALLAAGFADTFRHRHPDRTGAYTFWTYMMNSRAKNTGWRLDYFLVSERLLPAVSDSVIRSDVYGSDHCPISLFLHLTSAEKPKEP